MKFLDGDVFVDREHELLKLQSLADEIELSGGIGISIIGPSGIGKTALLKRFISVLPPGIRWSIAYGQARLSLKSQWMNNLFKNIGTGRHALVRALPNSLKNQFKSLEKDGFKEIDLNTFTKIAELIADRVPLLLFAEDVDSKERMDEVVSVWQRLWGLPVMLVVTAKTEPRHISGWEAIHLNPFSHAELNDLVTHFVGREQVPDFIDWLWHKSGGFPDKALKLLRFLVNADVMDEHALFVNYEQMDLSELVSECGSEIQGLGDDEMELLRLASCVDSIPLKAVKTLFPDVDLNSLKAKGLVRTERNRLRMATGLLADFIRSNIEISGCCDDTIRTYIKRLEPHQAVHLLLQVNSLNEDEKEFLERQLDSDWMHDDPALQKAIRQKLQIKEDEADFGKWLWQQLDSSREFENVEKVVVRQALDELKRSVLLRNEKFKEKLLEATLLCKKGQLEDSLKCMLEIYNSSPLGSEEWIVSAIEIGRLAYAIGDMEMSNKFLLEALREVRKIGHPTLTVKALSLELVLHGTKGMVSKMSSVLWSAMSMSETRRNDVLLLMRQYVDMLFFIGLYSLELNILDRVPLNSDEDVALKEFYIAETLIEMGQAELAVPRFREGWHLLRHIPLWRPVGERLKALISMEFGDMDEAMQMIEQAFQHYSEMKAIIGLIKSYAIRGEILLRQGEQRGFLEIKEAISLAKSKNYNLMLPYIFERGIRGLAFYGKDSADSNMGSLIKQYVEAVRAIGAEARISWFLNTLPDRKLREAIRTALSRSNEPQSLVRLKLLGPFKVILPSLDILMHIGSVKAKQVLATIAISPIARINTGAHALANMLWPDMAPSRQIHNIHWILTHIRKTLGQNIFRKEGDQYRLNDDFVWIDLLNFKRLVDEGSNYERLGRTAAAISKYESALKLVEGEPMADVVYESIEPFVQYIRRLIIECYTKVADYYLQAFDPHKAIRYASLGLMIEPLSERLKSVMLDAYIALGDNQVAQKEAEIFEKRLEI